ncbi:pentapeptide repeat-containing protein [bacterium SPL81]|nr:pentapeptide repeat-containing protein [Acinetobacter baumannii]
MINIRYIDAKTDSFQTLFLPRNNNLNLSGMGLHQAAFYQLDLYDVDFSNTRLISAQFVDSNFYNCDFSGVDFTAFTGLRTGFYNCIFNNTRFIASSFENCTWKNPKLGNVFIGDTAFINGDLRDLMMFHIRYIDEKVKYWLDLFFPRNSNLNLSGMNLLCAEFNGLDLYDVDFSGAKLIAAQFENANFYNCNFSEVEFIAFKGKKASFHNCNFTFARFISSDFENCTWKNARLNYIFRHNTEFINGDLA